MEGKGGIMEEKEGKRVRRRKSKEEEEWTRRGRREGIRKT